MADIKEIPLEPLTILGRKDNYVVPLAQFNLVDSSKRSETIRELMEQFASNEFVILGSTFIRVDSYDAIKIL